MPLRSRLASAGSREAWRLVCRTFWMSTPTRQTPMAAPRDRNRKAEAVATAWSAAETLDT